MRRPARTPLPIATIALAAAIVAVYGVEVASDDAMELCEQFGFIVAAPTIGRALSSVFLHDPGNVWHIAGNLAVLALIGSRVERVIGALRFAGLYFAGGLAGCGLHLVVDSSSTTALVGCSGSLFAVLALAAVLYGPGMLAFVVVLAGANVVQAFGGPGDPGASFAAHLGGFAAGVVVVGLGRAWRAPLTSRRAPRLTV